MPRLNRSESIYLLRDLLHQQISDGQRNMSVYVNEKQPSGQNAIHLYYTDDTDWVSQTQKKAPYYRINIQVAVRHNDYDSARVGAFAALEYINANRKPNNANYFIPDTTPTFGGQDERTKGYWFVILNGNKVNIS
jgi:hypothetical protein